MSELASDLDELERRIEQARRYLDYGRLLEEKSELEAQMSDPTLWDDPEKGRLLSMRFGRINADLTLVDGLQAKLSEARVADELLDEGALEFRSEIETLYKELVAELSELEIRSLLGGEFDEGDALCEIHAGAGGTDAQDWAAMMLRMYQRFVEGRGFEFELDEVTDGQEAGILSATFIVRGRYAYGLFCAEKGVHRLVRISPFDSQHRRQTSFASLEVTPLMADREITVAIDDKELRIDTFRSSGAGGQHVNVTDSAVRITHLPTGIVVSCQNERSQMQNKAKAMQMLVSKLEQRAREERRELLDTIAGPQSDVAWGSQIRSYVMAPYQMVKDHRSSFEDGNVEAVLNGDIEPFMEAYLQWRRATGAMPEGS